jgi:hypothetical protein
MDVKVAPGATKPDLPIEKMAQEAIEEAHMCCPASRRCSAFS